MVVLWAARLCGCVQGRTSIITQKTNITIFSVMRTLHLTILAVSDKANEISGIMYWKNSRNFKSGSEFQNTK
jgi:hypothetical protein